MSLKKAEMKKIARIQHEIAHGKMLASKDDTEKVWGWNTPAGRIRAIRRADLITSGAHLKEGVRTLEVGCGTGMFTEIFARTGAEIVAVDISPDLLRKARERNLSSDNVQFLEKRFEDCDVDGPFDAVIGSSILHHLEVERSFSKIYKLLKPGGVMSFAEPNMLNPQVFLERKLSFIRPLFSYVSPDETAFMRWSVKKLLMQVGFKDIKIIPFDWLHPATPSLFIDYFNRAGRLFENIPVIKEFAGSLYIFARRPL